MPASDIIIKGAREHNLRDVSLVLPRNKLICLTGVSGSGKSSLAFDTLYAEGQRRYVESLSSFARQFLGQMPKPDVDLISGLSPAISISQKSAGSNPRSTVGTITEIYDYLRVLYARVGDAHCYQCGRPVTAQTREQIIERIMQLPKGTKFMVLAPLIRQQKGEYRDLFVDLLKQGFARARVDGDVVALTDDLKLQRQMRHDIEVVVDRLEVKPEFKVRLAEAVDLAIKIGKGNLIVNLPDEVPEKKETEEDTAKSRRRKKRSQPGDMVLSVDYACTTCGISFDPPSPQLFSFNSPQGMCFECDGLGEFFSFDPELLIPDEKKNFKQGCFELIGNWKDLGRWRRHIYQGVADTLERVHELPEGTLLETPWNEMAEEVQNFWLWGAGDQHITYTYRGGKSPMKYGGNFEGIIPELLSKYRGSKSKMQIRRLETYMSTVECPDCNGQRLSQHARAFTVTSTNKQFTDHDDFEPSLSLPDVCSLTVADAVNFFSHLQLDETREIVASELLKEIRGRLGFLLNVGLDYLTLDRSAPTLSGGESQRIRLAGQIGCGLVGVLYILDEPSIGLHPRDNDRLLETLTSLRDLGNTVVVVEHDEDTMKISDHIIDFGPGAGVRGGEIVASGSLANVKKQTRSETGQYLSGKKQIEIPAQRRITIEGKPNPDRPMPTRQEGHEVPAPAENWLTIVGAHHNNLKKVDARIPLGGFVCVTGVSGSGKSSLVNDILMQALKRDLNRGDGDPGQHERIDGVEHLDKLISIDQSPIGRTPRSNPGTYIKVFDDVRNLFCQLPESKKRGYKPGRFSFNVEGGRCQACEGNGSTKLEMDFLADVWVKCPICEGHRFNRETLAIKFKDKSIAEVLEMDIKDGLEVFENIPKVYNKLQTLQDVGLDYLKLGQPSPTLSGGEAQRIKLARELVKKSTGKTLYLLDEPTTGLHFADIQMLLKVLHAFADAGNTVLVVEHNLDVIKTADWVIDIGPEGGREGGTIVVEGTPETVADCSTSYTGRALAPLLGRSVAKTNGKKPKTVKKDTKPKLATRIEVDGANQHNLKDVSVRVPRDEMTVFCGPSGSGKSSLAMDTIYAEGQRRYVESLSSYARQFVSQMQKPQLERIEGLSPAIAIEQQNLGKSPRSTVGTTTEIYDYLRILMARLGTPHCPDCDVPVGTQTSDEVVDKVMSMPEGTKAYLLAPVSIEVGQRYETLWDELRGKGFIRVRVDGVTHSLDEPPKIDRRRSYNVEVVVDRIAIKASSKTRIAESIEAGLDIGGGVIHVAEAKDETPEERWPVTIHSQHLSCEKCGRSQEPLTPHSFSFNSQLGWCPECEGIGTQMGANPAALLRSGTMTLAEGAVKFWPNVGGKVSQFMLEALSRETGIPLDVPFDELDGRQRRLVFHGLGEQWISVYPPSKKASPNPLFRFQFKGLYPALEESARLSQGLRSKLENLVDEVECSICGGSRVCEDASAARLRGATIDTLCRQPLGQLLPTIVSWKLNAREKKIAGEVLREVQNRLQFLNDVGLEYLTLSRRAATLSGGEAQRIRLASQLGSGLCGVLYVLDEPTIGLHPRDNTKLILALRKLRELGNTLILVEHDKEVIEGADNVIDFGPAAGKHGGQIVASGDPTTVGKKRTSVTGPYLTGKKAIPVPSNRRDHFVHDLVPEDEVGEPKNRAKKKKVKKKTPTKKSVAKKKNVGAKLVPMPSMGHDNWLSVIGARHNNLRNIDVHIPIGTLTAVTGVSGSGKSSLIDDILYATLAKTLHRARTVPGSHETIRGIEQINKVIQVNQQPLGNSPASNPATYTGVFELIRVLFAQLPESKLRGYTQRRFSFNAPGGRCEDCEGNGQKCIEMHFLPDVWVECETCRGRRYNEETLAVQYRGHSISDVLNLTCGEAAALFENIPKVRRILDTLCDVGLDYITLGQPAPTLSGGEAQRVKLAAELSRPDTGRTLYLLDEPTTGLHFNDLAKLLDVLNRLVDLGNTVVVIEHNLDVIKTADWIVDIGPEAGEGGGQIVAVGTPEDVAEYAKAASKQNGVPQKTAKKKTAKKKATKKSAKSDAPLLRSYTGEALTEVLAAGPYKTRKYFDFEAAAEEQTGDMDITEVGKQASMPWEIDGRKWHTEDRVDRRGEQPQWHGRILSEVVERIHDLGDGFSDTNWNNRSVVEITAAKKSDGWFFHAITAETWVLKMKFRVARGTFKRDSLQEQIGLKTFNQIEDLPVYGNDPRVKVKNLRGPFQEIEVRAYSFEEIDTEGFWSFLETAVNGFDKMTEKKAINPDDVMPWKKLGEKWHLSRRGFTVGKKPRWSADLLEELTETLRSLANDGQFLWNNQRLVHLFVSDQKEAWASMVTKKIESLDLSVSGPKGAFGLGRVANLGADRELDGSHPSRDVITIRFKLLKEVRDPNLKEFLKEHLGSVRQRASVA